MNLAEWAESQGIARVTAYRWFHQGKLPIPARKVGGLILVDMPDNHRVGQTVVYARVSSTRPEVGLGPTGSKSYQLGQFSGHEHVPGGNRGRLGPEWT